MWPRKFHEGHIYEHADYGPGTVTKCEPFKDPVSKEKFWRNTVQFSQDDGSLVERVFKSKANKHVILVFPTCATGEHSLPSTFALAPFDGTFQETLGDQNSKDGVENILLKLDLKSTMPEEVQSWDEFWAACPSGNIPSVSFSSPFRLPKLVSLERSANHSGHKRKISAVDDGNRDVTSVDVVCHKKIRAKDRSASMKVVQAFRQGDRHTDAAKSRILSGGDIVLVVDPDLKASTLAYSLPFFGAEIIEPTCEGNEVLIQILRPSDLASVEKKFVRWQGDDNMLWRPVIARSSIKHFLELTSRGKNSLQGPCNSFEMNFRFSLNKGIKFLFQNVMFCPFFLYQKHFYNFHI